MQGKYRAILNDNVLLKEQLEYAAHNAEIDPYGMSQNVDDVTSTLERIQAEHKEAGIDRRRTVPYLRDIETSDKQAGRLGPIDAANAELGSNMEAELRKFGGGLSGGADASVRVKAVTSERTEAVAGQHRAAARQGAAGVPAVEYEVDLPNKIRRRAGLPLRSNKKPSLGVFKPDDIKFSKTGYRFYDHKEVQSLESYYASERGREDIRSMAERNLRIVNAMPGCEEWVFTTNDENVADVIQEEIDALGEEYRKRLRVEIK